MKIFYQKFYIIAFLGVISEFVLAEKEDTSCKDIKTKSPYLQLNTRLFCNYDQETRPTLSHGKNATEIDVIFTLYTFTYVRWMQFSVKVT